MLFSRQLARCLASEKRPTGEQVPGFHPSDTRGNPARAAHDFANPEPDQSLHVVGGYPVVHFQQSLANGLDSGNTPVTQGYHAHDIFGARQNGADFRAQWRIFEVCKVEIHGAPFPIFSCWDVPNTKRRVAVDAESCAERRHARNC
jgi:hypothetical protein